MLIAIDAKFTISGDVVTAAADNPENGAEIMEILLSRDADVEISTAAIATVARKFDQEIIKILLVKNDCFEITKDVVTAAVWNFKIKKEVIEMLLSRDSPNVKVSAAAAVAIITHFDEEVVLKLLSRNFNIEISVEVVATIARRCNQKVMKTLLARVDNIEITEEVVTAAMYNWSGINGVVQVLLDADSNVKITAAATEAIMRNLERFDSQMTLRLLSRDVNMEEITEATIITIANRFDKKTIEFLLAKYPNIQKTKAVAMAAASNASGGKEMMSVLLGRGSDIKITGAAVAAIAKTFDREVMEMLLDNCNVEITEEVIITIASRFNKKVMGHLLAKNPDIQITEAVALAAASNTSSGKEMMSILLGRGSDIKITGAAVAAIAKTFDGEVMEMLLDNCNVEITEEVIITIASRFNKKVMGHLLAKNPDIQITEAVLVAAAGGFQGKETIEMLLTRDPTIEITEAVLVAAAGDFQGKETIEMLLTRDPTIEITEAVLVAAAGSFQAIEMLLIRDPTIEITEAVLVAVARSFQGKETIEMLLTRDPTIEITEAVLVAAAGSFQGKETIEMLLTRDPTIEITEAVLAAAA